ncbi:hypothetical protein [Actinomadura rayongensis]|uniref:Uncharacterized protein n=1 Tax=Actinomadura rayongensis TaxID=1429076 RepID=A0A6I4WBR8_9ACTN|nr:hypothetical protein [Actinomadura rayongensis]MXQ67021.1 hypothetical protein [Actinomadura rayongensis]
MAHRQRFDGVVQFLDVAADQPLVVGEKRRRILAVLTRIRGLEIIA